MQITSKATKFLWGGCRTPTLYSNKDIDFIRSPTTIKSPRVWTYKASICPWWPHSDCSSREPSSRSTHLYNWIFWLIAASNFPLKSLSEYTAPFVSFSAISWSFPSSTMKTRMRPWEEKKSLSDMHALQTKRNEHKVELVKEPYYLWRII